MHLKWYPWNYRFDIKTERKWLDPHAIDRGTWFTDPLHSHAALGIDFVRIVRIATSKFAILNVCLRTHRNILATAFLWVLLIKCFVSATKESDMWESQLRVPSFMNCPIVLSEHLHEAWSSGLAEFTVENDDDVLVFEVIVELDQFLLGVDVLGASNATAMKLVFEPAIQDLE